MIFLLTHVDVFQRLGQRPWHLYIPIDSEIPPVVHGCHKIPYATLPALKETHGHLKKNKIISRVTKPTAQINSPVITQEKNGSFPLCLNLQTLNKATWRQHFSISTNEDMQQNMAGKKKIFTILDEKDNYRWVKLNKRSTELCIFNILWNSYSFNNMPFGIK